MNFNFESDILNWSNSVISRLGHEPYGDCEASIRLSQVLNILRNKIPPIPRRIKVAKNFFCPQNHLNGYKQVISEIKNGTDLMPRASRLQMKKAVYNDLMLLDWGIHHLHLGTDKIKEGKNKGLFRGHKEILFVFISDDTAYIIGIFDHSSWTKQCVLETVHDNWPHILEPWKVRGALDLAIEPSDADRKSLRDAHVNTALKIGNNIYLGPGGGITTAGNGSNEIHNVNMILRSAEHLGDWINMNINFIEKIIGLKLGDINLDVSRIVLSNTFSILVPQKYIRIFIPSVDPVRSFIHPAHAHLVEGNIDNYSYYSPGTLSGIKVEKLRFLEEI